jgi:hypothetical protein
MSKGTWELQALAGEGYWDANGSCRRRCCWRRRGNYTNCSRGEPGISFLFRILNASCFCVQSLKLFHLFPLLYMISFVTHEVSYVIHEVSYVFCLLLTYTRVSLPRTPTYPTFTCSGRAINMGGTRLTCTRFLHSFYS